MPPSNRHFLVGYVIGSWVCWSNQWVILLMFLIMVLAGFLDTSRGDEFMVRIIGGKDLIEAFLVFL